MDLPNQEVVNSSQNDRIFKDISKNDRFKKKHKKGGLKSALSKR